MLRSRPVSTVPMEITTAVPMTMPSIANTDRSRCAARVLKASCKLSRSGFMVASQSRDREGAGILLQKPTAFVRLLTLRLRSGQARAALINQLLVSARKAAIGSRRAARLAG